MSIAPMAGAASTLAAQLASADVERMSRYRQYVDFYSGTQWEQRRRAGETRLVLNYARGLVRKSVSYLFSGQVGFNVRADGGEEVSGAESVERLLNDVLGEGDQLSADWACALDASVLGDGGQKVTWSKRLARPVIANVDPQQLWAWWYPDNPTEVYRVVQRLQVTPEEARLVYGVQSPQLGPSAPGSLERTVTVLEDWRADRLVIEVGGEVAFNGDNPYGWIPFILFPNTPRPHEFWGASDLEDLIDLCKELNQRFTTVSRILHVSGYPITVLENVDKVEGIRAEAGAVWELPEDSKAYLLDMLQSGGVRLHIEFIERIYQALHDLSETPRTAFGDSGRSLSGVALEVEIQPLVQKVMRKRRIWERVYRRRNALVLDLLERFGGQPVNGLRRTEPVWGDILPSDRTSEVAEAVQLVSAGISSRVAVGTRLGDQDAEATFAAALDEARQLAAIGGQDGNAERGPGADPAPAGGDDSGGVG